MARSSHPSNACTEEEIKADHHLLPQIISMFTHWQGYHSHNSRAKLGKRKVYVRHVPNKLKMEQKKEQTASCQDLIYMEEYKN